ncbi:ABC transporter substrate-binding protein [Patescibacteria group bacterium]|nr:ABC transporter substrate-binding protein [Patescibacteria group bacterium]
MKKILVITILLTSIMGLDALAGRSGLFSSQIAVGQFEQKMTIGLLLPLSGELAAEGRSAKRGFELAAEGLKVFGVGIIFEDSRCDRQYASGAIDRLLTAKIDAVIGGLCDEVVDVAEQRLAEEGIIFISLDSGQPLTTTHLNAVIETKKIFADYFVSQCVNRYGVEPDYITALAFDVLTALVVEIRDVVSEDESWIDQLTKIRHYGVSGEVRFQAAAIGD